ncbi:DUF6603 domain-containing protein [Parafrankia sp. EUN1f]|uniref:DUF6603 domain-containing protein n=1 Tax=Parafrankia sp. EUN1f TaxID=102897 RepID=UPI0001C4753B|nr:DUF6603 domain-containing protein [Parafrankia sp. EUN1f]EFC79450.1 hypothetical protein FrEUN1fDRAFT_7433 [Parafrankia sp. EUN1f]
MDLDALKEHLLSLGDPPTLRAADTALPAQLCAMLATFPDGVCQGAAGSGRPEVDAGRTTLSLSLTWTSPAWPVGAAAAVAVTGVSVTVTSQGLVTLTLGGTFDSVEVVVTVTADDLGRLTAAVRPVRPGAFAAELEKLGRRLGGDAVWQEVTEGLRAFAFDPADVAGFDYRLTEKMASDPVVYEVDAMAIVASLTIRTLPLDVSVWLPHLALAGMLTDARPIPVRSVLESFGIPAGEVPENCAVSELAFAAVLGDEYLLRMTVTGDWSVGPFVIRSLDSFVHYASDAGFTARVGGTVSIGSGLNIVISAGKVSGAQGGWEFSGGLEAGETLGMTEVIDALGLTDVPGPVRSLELTALTLSYTTGSTALDFVCEGDLTITDGVKATLRLTVTRDGTSTRYGGTLDVDGYIFEVDFDAERSGTDILVATYLGAAEGTEIVLRDWVAHFSADLAADVPDSLRTGLKDAKFVWVKPAGGPARFCVGVDLSAGFDLSGLPLVGGFLSTFGTVSVENLQVLYTSGAFDAQTVASVNQLLGPAKVVTLPPAGLAAGVAALAELRIGKETTSVALGVPPSNAGGGLPGGSDTSGTEGTSGTGGTSGNEGTSKTPDTKTPDTTGTGSSSVHWVSVQKQLGIVHLNRVGVVYQHNVLLFALDASVALGPLALSLDGLAVGSRLDRFAPTFRLDGLGIGYSAAPVEISGALLHLPDDQLPDTVAFQYDGTATVGLPSFSLAGLGSYAQLTDDAPSLFVFAQLEAPLGGPPPVLVTGLMAGFGFNRELTLPSPREVSGFPLLSLHKQGPGSGSKPSHVLDVLEGRESAVTGSQPRRWIAPREGSYWLALGVEFTVAEVVNARMLMAAEIGADLALALLGLATIQLPLPSESASTTYVYAELGLEAVIRPTQGSAEIAAQLSPASYVLTPACHLTGGFAAATWFGANPHAGQFVVTLGGYHPAFSRPSYYPDAPRLGIDWAVSGNVSIRAQAYLAVTPSCAMAGARLEVLFHEGAIRAWFTAQADMLLSWRPFFFDARISVSIGASGTVNLGILHITIGGSVGATLHLWGPPTGGSVTAHFPLIDVTVSFGGSRGGGETEALGWDVFASMLPKPADVVTIAPVAGVDSAVADPDAGRAGGSAGGKVWQARARDLRLFTQSAVPASHLRTGDAALGSAEPGDGPLVDVRPMDRVGLVGEHRLRLFYADRPAATDGWTFTPRTRGVPASLWGAPPIPFSHTPSEPSAEVLADRPVGFDVQAPRPELAASRGVFPLSEYSEDELPSGLSPLPRQPAANGDYLGVPDPTSVELLGRLDRGDARSGRDEMYAALADAKLLTDLGDRALVGLAAGAAHFYSQAPMVQNTTDDAESRG